VNGEQMNSCAIASASTPRHALISCTDAWHLGSISDPTLWLGGGTSPTICLITQVTVPSILYQAQNYHTVSRGFETLACCSNRRPGPERGPAAAAAEARAGPHPAGDRVPIGLPDAALHAAHCVPALQVRTLMACYRLCIIAEMRGDALLGCRPSIICQIDHVRHQEPHKFALSSSTFQKR